MEGRLDQAQVETPPNLDQQPLTAGLSKPYCTSLLHLSFPLVLFDLFVRELDRARIHSCLHAPTHLRTYTHCTAQNEEVRVWQEGR